MLGPGKCWTGREGGGIVEEDIEEKNERRERERERRRKGIRNSFPHGSKIRNKKFRAVRGCGLLVGDSKLNVKRGSSEREERKATTEEGGKTGRSEINRTPEAAR